METEPIDLPHLFQQVTAALILRQDELNASDPYNRNHGDHMVQIFQIAADAAELKRDAALAESMQAAVDLLRQHPENGSAQVYARGLSQLAQQFRQRGIGLEDLSLYVQGTLHKGSPAGEDAVTGEVKSGEILKALLNALAGWENAEASPLDGSVSPAGEAGAPQESTKGGLDMGYLFGVGMSYLQARQKGGDPLDVLVETVVSASPLARQPHRDLSGKIALRSLLEAMH